MSLQNISAIIKTKDKIIDFYNNEDLYWNWQNFIFWFDMKIFSFL